MRERKAASSFRKGADHSFPGSHDEITALLCEGRLKSRLWDMLWDEQMCPCAHMFLHVCRHTFVQVHMCVFAYGNQRLMLGSSSLVLPLY